MSKVDYQSNVYPVFLLLLMLMNPSKCTVISRTVNASLTCS